MCVCVGVCVCVCVERERERERAQYVKRFLFPAERIKNQILCLLPSKELTIWKMDIYINTQSNKQTYANSGKMREQRRVSLGMFFPNLL